MPRWTDLAQWVGPTVNCGDGDSAQNEPGDRVADHMYLVLHIAQGSYVGTVAWQRNPDANVSSHFIVAKDGRCAQMVDTSIRAWTQAAGNPYSISIEFEGWVPDKLTPQQHEVAAQLLARCHRVHGIPLQVTNRVGTRGLGHHSMGAESGVNWGHSQCPGTSIKAQKQSIVDRAADIVNGVTVTAPFNPYADPTLRTMAQRIDAMRSMDPAYEVEYDNDPATPKTPEINELAVTLSRIAAQGEEILARSPVSPAPVDLPSLVAALRPVIAEETERAVRKVLGAVDGASPPAGG